MGQRFRFPKWATRSEHRSSRQNALARSLYHRRLSCESLEDRRLLSIFAVTNLSNSGAGSLRQAIANANSNTGADTITFASSLAGNTITLTSGQLNLTDTTGKTTINGLGADQLTVSGNDASRVFYINSGMNAEISGLTIAHGHTTGTGFATYGGGIYNDGMLTIANCTISENSSSVCGGGIANFAGR